MIFVIALVATFEHFMASKTHSKRSTRLSLDPFANEPRATDSCPTRSHHLDLETPRSSPSTCALKLPAFALDVRFLRFKSKSAKPILSILNPTLGPIVYRLRTRLTFPLCGPKPKCFTASLAFFGPLNNNVLLPVGALSAN